MMENLLVVNICSEDVANIIEAVAKGSSQKLKLAQHHEQVEVHSNGVPIARLQWEFDRQEYRVVALACHSGSHGFVEPRWGDLARKLKSFGRCDDIETCVLCNGTGWLPADGQKAKTAAVIAATLKMYRGVRFMPSSEFARFVDTMSAFTLASLMS